MRIEHEEQNPIMMQHKARKRFGQNFLQDQGVISQILRAVNAKPGQNIVEIGPGQGAITEGLVASGADVTAIEIDKDLIHYLNIAFINKDNFRLIDSDALKIDFSSLVKDGKKFSVVGNLPYNISTPLLFHLLSYKEHIDEMYFMLQKEVVDRMAAEPNCKAYGKLSIMCQYHCDVRKVIDVPPGCFSPAPKVDSAVVRLRLRKFPLATANNEAKLKEIVSAAFQQRRKTVSNALKNFATTEDIEACGINPKSRADNIRIEEYINLTNSLSLSE